MTKQRFLLNVKQFSKACCCCKIQISPAFTNIPSREKTGAEFWSKTEALGEVVEDVKEEKVEETLPFKGVEGTVADISKAEEMKKSGEIPSYLTKQRFLLNITTVF